ncbi:Histone-Lysine N-Methyltransferase ash1l [Geranomyces variabilis]|uniref:Histone-Lysine N-Methyltransferase ash1l n=1 Tax=Geranomyces variabilis TaxID=109894 RepID=A0AAD5TPY6_9FUNG|nr:Histone-Lysine N-Methyltransferase ash1l [Geranomyces variabilis]
MDVSNSGPEDLTSDASSGCSDPPSNLADDTGRHISAQIVSFFGSDVPPLFTDSDPTISRRNAKSAYGALLLEYQVKKLLDPQGSGTRKLRASIRPTVESTGMTLPTLLQQWINDAAGIVTPNSKRRKTTTLPLPPGKYAEEAEARWAGPPLLEELYAKKSYLTAGLYSSAFKTSTNTPGPIAQTGGGGPLLPLPMYYGATLMSTEQDFSLPYDFHIFVQAACGVTALPTAATKPPSAFTKIQKNIFVDRRPNKCKEIAVCHCEKPEDPNAWACTENCLNRCMMIECNPEECPAGDRCANQRFRNKEHVADIEVVWTAGRGYGLQATSAIRASTLVLEYRGEIISQETCLDRMRDQYAHLENHYFLNYSRGEVIDGCRKGTDARFVNHSCEPNCHIEKWMVDGEYAVGLFAKKDIAPGDELTYDYRFESFGPMKPCLCGAPTCRGFIGLNKKVEVPKPDNPIVGRSGACNRKAATKNFSLKKAVAILCAIGKSGYGKRKAHTPRRKRVLPSDSSPRSSPPLFSLLPPTPSTPNSIQVEATNERQANRTPSSSRNSKRTVWIEERENVRLRHRADIVARAYKLLLKQRKIYSTLRVFQVRCALAGARSLLPVLGLDSNGMALDSRTEGSRDVGTPRARPAEEVVKLPSSNTPNATRCGLDTVVTNLWQSAFGHAPPEDDEPRRQTRSKRNMKSSRKSKVVDALIVHFENLNQAGDACNNSFEDVTDSCVVDGIATANVAVAEVSELDESVTPHTPTTRAPSTEDIAERPSLRRSARRSQGGVDNDENASPTVIARQKKLTLGRQPRKQLGALGTDENHHRTVKIEKMSAPVLNLSGQGLPETPSSDRRASARERKQRVS